MVTDPHRRSAATLRSIWTPFEPWIHACAAPCLQERWLGVSGRRTTLNGAPLRTRPCPDVKLAYLYATTPHMFSGPSQHLPAAPCTHTCAVPPYRCSTRQGLPTQKPRQLTSPGAHDPASSSLCLPRRDHSRSPGATEVSFNRLRDAVRIPMYGCDCYAYGLLAAGHCDLVVEADLKPYDYMALVPVIQARVGGHIQADSLQPSARTVWPTSLHVAQWQQTCPAPNKLLPPDPHRSPSCLACFPRCCCLQGAGGVITDWHGRPLVWRPPAGAASNEALRAGWPGEVCAAGDPSLHAKAIALLDWK
jgi:fructose-1,6-bisphosphatase/inositol monophosphatase family enzyme